MKNIESICNTNLISALDNNRYIIKFIRHYKFFAIFVMEDIAGR